METTSEIRIDVCNIHGAYVDDGIGCPDCVSDSEWECGCIPIHTLVCEIHNVEGDA